MKLKTVYETEAYVSDVGYFVIRQDDGFSVEGPTILLSPEQVIAIKKYMADFLEIQKSNWVGGSDKEHA